MQLYVVKTVHFDDERILMLNPKKGFNVLWTFIKLFIIRIHWTTGIVPAVNLGIIAGALGLEDILTQRFA